MTSFIVTEQSCQNIGWATAHPPASPLILGPDSYCECCRYCERYCDEADPCTLGNTNHFPQHTLQKFIAVQTLRKIFGQRPPSSLQTPFARPPVNLVFEQIWVLFLALNTLKVGHDSLTYHMVNIFRRFCTFQ